MAHQQRQSSLDEVVGRIPPSALRDICARDPHLNSPQPSSAGNKENEAPPSSTAPNRPPRLAKTTTIATKTKINTNSNTKKNKKKLTAREARSLVVAEIERLAVRDFCHHAPTAHLLAAVDALGIDHAAMGNSATSRSVAVKRLTEHIASLSGTQSSGAGLVAFLGNEASVELVDDLVTRLVADDESVTARSSQTKKVKAVAQALQHEAMLAFFESFPEAQLHDICFAMKNEKPQGETSSRRVLAASIVGDQPVSQLTKAEATQKKAKTTAAKPQKLSRRKPELADGVTYADVFQWYNLSELQAFARDHSLKVSGKKKELIHRILDHLADPTPSAQPALTKAKAKKTKTKKSSSDTGHVAPTPPTGAAHSKRVQELLERILQGCKAVNKPLSEAQIDECERELKKSKGEGARLPDALRQLYATCNGFCVHGDWTSGFYIFPLIEEGESRPVDNEVLAGNGEEWIDGAVKKYGIRPEQSVAHRSWLSLAGQSEYEYMFINVDPASPDFGTVRWCINSVDEEGERCADLEALLAQVVRYVERRESARREYAAEDPEADAETLEDWVVDQVMMDEDDDDDDDDEEEDKEGSDSGDDDGDQEVDE